MTEHIVYWTDNFGALHAEHAQNARAADRRVTYLVRRTRRTAWHSVQSLPAVSERAS